MAKNTRKRKHKLLVLFLTLAMCVGMSPAVQLTVFAGQEPAAESATKVTTNSSSDGDTNATTPDKSAASLQTQSTTNFLVGTGGTWSGVDTRINSIDFGTVEADTTSDEITPITLMIEVPSGNKITINDYYILDENGNKLTNWDEWGEEEPNTNNAFGYNAEVTKEYSLGDSDGRTYMDILTVYADATYLSGDGNKAKTYTGTLVLEISPTSFTWNSNSVTDGKLKIPLTLKVTGDNDTIYPAVEDVSAEAGNAYVNLKWAPIEDNLGTDKGTYVIYRSTIENHEENPSDYEELALVDSDYFSYDESSTFCTYTDYEVINDESYSYKVAAVGTNSHGTQKYGIFSEATEYVTPGASAKAKLPQPQDESNTSYGTDGKTVEYRWGLYDPTDNGEGSVNHFIVYKDGTPIMSVPQSEVKKYEVVVDGNTQVRYYWEVAVPIDAQYQWHMFTVAAVNFDGEVGLSGANRQLTSRILKNLVLKYAALRYENMDDSGWGVVFDLQDINYTKFDAKYDKLLILRDGEEIQPDTLEHSGAATVTYYIDRDVSPGKTYSYEITPIDNDGEALGDTQNLTITIPNKHTEAYSATPIIENFQVDFGTVHFDYSAPMHSGPIVLNVYRDDGDDDTLLATQEISASGDGEFSYIDKTVKELGNGTYNYRVELTETNTGVSYTSNIFTYTKGSSTDNLITLPENPGAVTVTAGNGKVKVTWEASEKDATSYVIYRQAKWTNYEDTYSDSEELATVDKGKLTYTDKTVKNGTTYRYVIRAKNGVGESEGVTSVDVTPSEDFSWATAKPSTPVIADDACYIAPDAGKQNIYILHAAWDEDPYGEDLDSYKIKVYQKLDVADDGDATGNNDENVSENEGENNVEDVVAETCIFDDTVSLDNCSDWTFQINEDPNADVEGTYRVELVAHNAQGDSETPATKEISYHRTSLLNENIYVDDSYTYNAGNEIEIAPKVKYNGKTLKKGKDYVLEIRFGEEAVESVTELGDYSVAITGINNYKGTGTKDFAVKRAALNNVTLQSNGSYAYSGKVITPGFTVKDAKGNTLVKGDDYTVSYSNGRKNVGTYKATITGIGGYDGTIAKTFKINPKGTTIKTPSKGKKFFTAKWKKQSAKMATSRITGYQVQYSTSSKFIGAKTVTVKGYAKTSKKIGKLKSKKTYYVKVRTYKTVSGKKYYSIWSKVKKVKTK